MNIAFIGAYAEESVDGVSTSAFHLATELVRQGHNVWFYSLGTTTEQVTDDNGIHHRRYPGQLNSFNLPTAFVRLLRRNVDQIDVFHIHSVFIPFNTRTAQILAGCRLPYVLTPNGGYNLNILRHGRVKKSLYLMLFERRMVAKSAGIIAVAGPELADIESMGFDGLVDVIPNPVNVPKEEAQQKAPMRMDRIQLLYLGRYVLEHKGLDRLLGVFGHLVEMAPGARLELCGTGQDEFILRTLADRFPAGSVRVRGPVFGAAKWQAFRDATIYVQTSRWEAFGVSIAEAMFLGRPVALSKGCYLSGMLEQNDVGLVLSDDLQEAAGQILTAHRNRGWMETHGARCRALAEREFAVSVVANRVTEFYQRACKGNAPSG